MNSPVLMKFVENDNMQYFKEVQNNMNNLKSLGAISFTRSFHGGNAFKKDDDDDEFGGAKDNHNHAIF